MDGTELAERYLALGFTLVVFVQAHCSEHGDFRMGIAELGEVRCPLCDAKCEHVELGRGLTKRPAPFFQLICSSLEARNKGYRDVPRALFA